MYTSAATMHSGSSWERSQITWTNARTLSSVTCGAAGPETRGGGAGGSTLASTRERHRARLATTLALAAATGRSKRGSINCFCCSGSCRPRGIARAR